MNFANRSFRNNITGEVIRVIDSFENIAILENRSKIDVSQLTNQQLFTEQFTGNVLTQDEIDPNNFFTSNAYSAIADRIKNIPDNFIDDPSAGAPIIKVEGGGVDSIRLEHNNNIIPTFNESAVIMKSEDDERAELARKYGVINNQDEVNRQNEAFSRLLNDEDPVQSIEVDRRINEDELNKDIYYGSNNTNITYKNEENINIESPIVTMFKSAKRNVDFNISINVNNKIPRLDFIEMMEDTYEVSIIDFLAEDITNSILKDPSVIKNLIKDEINKMLHKKVKVTTENKSIVDSKSTKPRKYQIRSKKEDSFKDNDNEVVKPRKYKLVDKKEDEV